MTVIVCVDDRLGMMFGKRRQSMDAALQARVLDRTKESSLWMNAYTQKQFAAYAAPQITVSEEFLSAAPEDAFCFVEDAALAPYADRVDTIILYRWNRRYPGTLFFDLPLGDYTLCESTDFAGNSHETITEEIYTR